MSAPQLTDSSVSREWARTVEGGATADQPRRTSQPHLDDAVAVARRRRFVRLVTYTMIGLVAFTLLGVARFASGQRAMQSALAAPAPGALVAPAGPGPAPAAPAAAEAPEVAPALAAPAVAPSAARAVPKARKKPLERPAVAGAKPTAKSAVRR